MEVHEKRSFVDPWKHQQPCNCRDEKGCIVKYVTVFTNQSTKLAQS
jgi:hypothetical protein